MHLTGGNEHERTRFHGVPLRSVKKESRAARDKITLIARVGFLGIAANRRVHFHSQRAMREDRDGEIAGRLGGPLDNASLKPT